MHPEVHVDNEEGSTIYTLYTIKYHQSAPTRVTAPPEFLHFRRLDCQHALCGGANIRRYHVSAPTFAATMYPPRVYFNPSSTEEGRVL